MVNSINERDLNLLTSHAVPEQKRVFGLSEQPLDCSDSPLGLAIALWISWAARQMLYAINLCKSSELYWGPLLLPRISGILYQANIALSVAMMLAEEADVSFLNPGK